MDSIRITWDADHDTYVIHIPHYGDSVVTVQGLEELKAEINRQLRKASA